MRRILLLAMVAAAATTALHAADGAMPIWEPTVITQPGHYVVTRDITTAAGPVLNIQVANVSIDFNCNTLETADAAAAVVHYIPPPTEADHADGSIRIFNGTLHGGMYGVLVEGPAQTAVALHDLRIGSATEAAVKVDNVGSLEARGIIVIDAKVGMDLATDTSAGDPRGQASISDVSIQAEGGIHCASVNCDVRDGVFDIGSAVATTPALMLTDAVGGGARGIIIVNSMPAGSNPMVELIGSRGIIIVNSRVYGGGASGISPCVRSDATSHDTRIQHSSLSGCGQEGVRLLSDGNVVADNSINDNGTDGIHV
ncbi:MAG: hypothetical protein OER88_14865, partial [Planctomycetota bacterium]|nr:hypothetical protein [Planctomycetota bacterium]